MCSPANYVLPLRRNSEVSLDRLCGGVPLPAIAPATRSHGTTQDTDMDLAWQELMAITELQEFKVANEGPYEMPSYNAVDSVVPLRGFGTAQAPTEPLSPGFNLAAACQRPPYHEGIPACQRLSASADQFGPPGGLLLHRMMPSAQLPQPPPMSLEQPIVERLPEEHRTASAALARGSIGGMPGRLPGRDLRPHSADDLESDSGLSLGSSPPLASPNDAAPNVLAYQNHETNLNVSDREMESMTVSSKRASLQYSMEYPDPPFPAYQSSYFMGQHSSAHTQPRPMAPLTGKQHQSQDSAMSDMNASGTASRGSFCPGLYSKSGGSAASATAPLSRDERRAMTLKIPFPMEKIVNLPVDDFNELLTQNTLTDNQTALVRDIRRRGKNKVAAQNCRKRKLQNIAHLEGELSQLQAQRDHLTQERLSFQNSLAYAKCRLSGLYTEVFSQLRDENGHPYSIEDFSLQQTPDGKLYLVPVQKGQEIN